MRSWRNLKQPEQDKQDNENPNHLVHPVNN